MFHNHRVVAYFFLSFLVILAGCGGGSSAGNLRGTPGPAPTPAPPPTPGPSPSPTPPQTIQSLNHVIVMMQENRSFDSYFGFMTQYRQKNGIPINSSDGKILDLSDPAAQTAGAKNG